MVSGVRCLLYPLLPPICDDTIFLGTRFCNGIIVRTMCKVIVDFSVTLIIYQSLFLIFLIFLIYLNVMHQSKANLPGYYVLGYLTQDSKCDISSSKYQLRFHQQFPTHSFPLFIHNIKSELQIKNNHCAPNRFQDNFIISF